MNLTGEYRINAGREVVWAALNDPNVLRRCIPGCEEIDQHTPTQWTARVLAKVGPVKARFSGKISLEDLDPPSGCRIVGEGNGGVAGFAKGGALVKLNSEGPQSTHLFYEADAKVGGKLAQVGSRLIEGTAKKYADEFFASFSRIVGGEEEVASAAAIPAAQQSQAAATAARVAIAPPAQQVVASSGPSNWVSFILSLVAIILSFLALLGK